MSKDADAEDTLDPTATEELAQGEAEGAERAQESQEDAGEQGGRTSRVLRMARKLMDRKELTQDTRELLVSVLATSDKAKTEAVRMVAREVRNYLEALELKDELLNLITSYSLEVSVRLKPLADAIQEEERKREGES